MADISKIKPNGTEYNLKDATARAGIESSKTIKSSVVTVNDAAPINAEDITVDITPVQDLHGYDRPWAGGAGKNKLRVTATTTTTNGVTFTVNADGSVKVNGTATADITFNLGAYLLKGGTAMYLTGSPIAGASNTIWLGYKGYSAISAADGQLLCDRRTSETDWDNYVYIGVANGYTVNNITFKPMMRDIAVSDTTFEPYSNICPIEGWTGAELERLGKNWLNYSSDNVGWASDIATIVDVLNSLPEGDYTLTVPFTLTSISGDIANAKCQVRIDINSSTIYAIESKIWGSATIGTTKTITCQIRVDSSVKGKFTNCYLYGCGIDGVGALGTASVSNAQLELGTQPTTYEPYQHAQATANFGETVYGGKWHVTEGGTDNERGKIDCEDINFSHNTSAGGLNWYDLNSPLSITPMSNLLSYKSNPHEGWYSTVPCLSINGQQTLRIYGTNELFATGGAYEGAYIVYELATPTTISTPKQNVPMLKGINTVSANCGDTQLKYQPDNVIGELKGEIEDNIIYEDYKWTTESSQSYSAGTPGTYGTSCWRDVKKEGYDVIGVTFVENRRFGDCILTLYYIPSTSHVEVIIFRATSSAVTIADEDIEYRVAYKKRT